MTNIIKEPVRLREKALVNGSRSLYLDIYVNGRRKYEFLKLYLIPETDRQSKERNKETLRLANAVKSQRVVDIQSGRYGFNSRKEMNRTFEEYFEVIIDEKKRSNAPASTVGNLRAALYSMQKYVGTKHPLLSEIDKAWLEGYADWLEQSTLSQNTKVKYYENVRTALNRAYKDGLITECVSLKARPMKREETHREYLTIEEIRTLADSPVDTYKHEVVKRAFLFSCLTGLRFSDVSKLKWGNVHTQDGMTRIVFTQKKTKGLEYLDINPQAAALLGNRGNEQTYVFEDMLSLVQANVWLRKWVSAAGIEKHISFHCSRHTFAVMMLDIGTDIYTVSKLLGHRELKTTQIYAKILDKNKQAAVMSIPKVL